MAQKIKKDIDYNERLQGLPGKGAWHCIVGSAFGSAVSHETEFSLLIKFVDLGISVCIQHRSRLPSLGSAL